MKHFRTVQSVCSKCTHTSEKVTLLSKASILGVAPQRRYTSHVVQDERPFRMAVIGSGPAGFYTAFKVMSTISNSVVDMYEHLPVPFGLVRFGVAPDHPEVKNCQEKFAEVASSPRFSFIGNVDVGKGLPLKSLKHNYNAILFAYGASKDRKLGISGEDKLKGIYSARAFVGWYNGLPEYAKLAPALDSGEDAVVIGQGNVALDITRTLLSDVDTLRKTDMTDQALAALSKSRVKRVRVVGRRGPMQVSFTIKEVRELLKLPSVGFEPIDRGLFPPDLSKLPRTSKRLTQLLSKGSSFPPSAAQKSWSLDFLQSPSSFNPSNSIRDYLSSVTFVKNAYQGPEPYEPSAKVAMTEEQTLLPASLAFRSIGYKSEEIPGMKDLGIVFDENQGIIPNDDRGRVIGPSSGPEHSKIVPGMYCTGWVKAGPTGVIANTMEDAFTTAGAIAKDWENRAPFLDGGRGWEALKEEARNLGLRSVSWSDWEKIDDAEKKRGVERGKEREKFSSVKEMLEVLE